jgi:hypothetical protein
MKEEVALITIKEIKGAEDIGGNVGLNLKVLPEKKIFAECQVFCRVVFSDTRQRGSLPRAFFRHSAKKLFAECLFSTLGKESLCRVFFLEH